MKFIGISLSRCLFSLAREEVGLDSVAFILTNTAYPSREVMIEQVRQTMMGMHVETHVANAIALWDSGRIYQASTRPAAHATDSEACWLEAPAALIAEPAAEVELSKSDIVKQFADKHGIEVIDVAVAEMDPTYVTGIPLADMKFATSGPIRFAEGEALTEMDLLSFEEFLAWGKRNGLHPNIGIYLEEMGDFAGATPKEWFDFSRCINLDSFKKMPTDQQKFLLEGIINKNALDRFVGFMKDLISKSLM